MASEGEIYLGPTGSESLVSNFAREVVRSFEPFGRRGRTANGKYKEDIASRKYTFRIPYEYIDQTTLTLLYTKYSLDVPMNLRMYISDIAFFTNFDGNCPVVKMTEFSSTDFITGRATKIYKDTAITFIEM